MLTGILKASDLPWRDTFWRFLASLHLSVAGQLLQLQRILRDRVWEPGRLGISNTRCQSRLRQCG